jgi:uncharacterized glyoxalase superfamily protein PhnB
MADQQTASPSDDRRRTGPETLRLRNVAPSLTVDDLERSRRFYVDGLGFTVKETWEKEGKVLGYMLVAGSCEIGIGQDDWAKGRDRQKGIGFRLYAETVQDLDAIAERLREQGIEHEGPKESSWGPRILSVTDPDGFAITLHS